MSIISAILSSRSGLTAAAQRAEIVSGNIANAQDENYARRSLQVTEGVGGGVSVVGVSRAMDNTMDALFRTELSYAAKQNAIANALGVYSSQIGTLDSETSIPNLMSAFQNDLGLMANDPGDTSMQQEVMLSAKALAAMKMAEPGFSVSEFLGGARGAYEMILMAFERGDIKSVEAFLSEDVNEAFVETIALREDQGLKVEASFVGLRELELNSASFDAATAEAEISVLFVAELTSVVRNSEGEIVEGNPNEIKRQRDIWTFARRMGVDDPNWQLVATGG